MDSTAARNDAQTRPWRFELGPPLQHNYIFTKQPGNVNNVTTNWTNNLHLYSSIENQQRNDNLWMDVDDMSWMKWRSELVEDRR